EPHAVAPERVVQHVVIGERPEQRTYPAVPAVAMLPPSARAASAVPTCQRGAGGDLYSCNGPDDPVGTAGGIRARSGACRLQPDMPIMPATQAAERQRRNGAHHAERATDDTQAPRLDGARRRH